MRKVTGALIRPVWIAILLVSMALTAPASDVAGLWKVRFSGPPRRAPKTVGSMILDLTVDGDQVAGTVRIGTWPGEAPIADGKIEGERITFTATGYLSSTTGIPTCQFVATVHGDEMTVTMTAIRNPGGPLAPGAVYEYNGTKSSQEARK